MRRFRDYSLSGVLRAPSDDGGGAAPPVSESVLKNKTFTYDDLSELRRESAGHRVRAKESETKAAEIQAALDKANGDLRAASERLTASEAAALDRVLRAELKTLAVKEGMVDLDGLKILDLSGVTLDKDGKLVGADALMEAAKKSKPYLFGAVASSSGTAKVPGATPPVAKSAKDMTAEEYATAKAELIKVRR